MPDPAADSDIPEPIALRLWALETMLAFTLASAHMQSVNPSEAARRVRKLLLDQDWAFTGIPEERRGEAVAELERLAERIERIQQELPRRLVD